MSNFKCEICGTAILEGEDGVYKTECEHYPLEQNAAEQDVLSIDWLTFIKALPESEDYVYQDEDGCWITQEWLCGTFAGRGFVAETHEQACAQMIDYLNSHIGHVSVVGNIVTASGWPDQRMVKEYLNANVTNQVEQNNKETTR